MWRFFHEAVVFGSDLSRIGGLRLEDLTYRWVCGLTTACPGAVASTSWNRRHPFCLMPALLADVSSGPWSSGAQEAHWISDLPLPSFVRQVDFVCPTGSDRVKGDFGSVSAIGQ